jgi:hypothetical protein
VNLPPPTKRHATRRLLAEVAQREAAQERAGDANMAGPAIEPYLSVLREALNQNGSTTKYSDLATGFNWCCAFVYYCCLQAGFQFPPKPIPGYRYTLGAVPAWHHWAISEGFFHPTTTTEPQVGDIALYNQVFDGQPLDHIGIVVGTVPGGVLTAEGNNSNRTGVFSNAFSAIEGYVRLPESA